MFLKKNCKKPIVSFLKAVQWLCVIRPKVAINYALKHMYELGMWIMSLNRQSIRPVEPNVYLVLLISIHSRVHQAVCLKLCNQLSSMVDLDM